MGLIQIDHHESQEYDHILSQVVPIERKILNQLPGQTEIKPDFVILNGGNVVCVNHKQAGEAIGGLSKLEEQLGRELAGLEEGDNLVVMIDGMITIESDGSCLTWVRGKHSWIPGKHYGIHYSSVAGFFTRLWRMGIPVVRTNGVYESCSEMLAIYNDLGKEDWEHKTFNRLIKEQYTLSGKNKLKPQKVRDFALTLMSLPKAGMAEEAAMSIAEYFYDINVPLSLMGIIQWIQAGNFISGIPMRSGKRNIGGSIEGKFREAVGLKQ